MKKVQRQVDSLVELLKEQAEIERQIELLPRGYISVKKISGHIYNYRQWRDGTKIVSEYVPEAFINSTKRKIAARKEQENLLKAVKKDIKSVVGKCMRAGLIDEKKLNELKKQAKEEIK